jgi:hypothetical protein
MCGGVPRDPDSVQSIDRRRQASGHVWSADDLQEIVEAGKLDQMILCAVSDPEVLPLALGLEFFGQTQRRDARLGPIGSAAVVSDFALDMQAETLDPVGEHLISPHGTSESRHEPLRQSTSQPRR